MRLITGLVLTAALLFPATSFAGTASGVVTEKKDVFYTFTASEYGTLYTDVMWKQPHSDAFAVLVCQIDDLQTTVLGLTPEDRGVIEMTTGVFPGSSCAVGVLSIGKAAAFTISVRSVNGKGPVLRLAKSDIALSPAIREAFDKLRQKP